MITPRVTRALNPHKRKFTLKQIRAGFGGKRRQAGLKAKRHPHKARKAKATASNPKPKRRASAKAKTKNATQTKVVYRTKYKTRTKKVYVKAATKPKRKANAKRRRSSNPGQYLATLMPVGNPHQERRKSVAKHKRKVSAKGRSGKRHNPTRHHRRAARHGGHHRNPFGVSSTAVKGIIGAAIGFSAGKKLPPLFGAQMNSSPVMTLLSTALTTAGLVWAAKKFAPAYADGVFIGGGMAVLNVAINAWGGPLMPYSGLGDFVAGGFPLPQGPVRYPMALGPAMAPNGSQVDVGAFGTAFTRAW